MEDGWFIKRGGERQGPLSLKQFKTLAASGELKPTDWVARKGMAKWVAALEVDGLFAAPALPPSDPVVIEATAVSEAAVVDPPVIAPASAASQRSPLPWILASVAGGGALVLGCSGILCTGVMLLSSWSGDDASSTALVGDSSSGALAGSGAGWTSRGDEGNAGDNSADAMQELLESLRQQSGDALSGLSPEIAAVVAKADGGDVESMYELGHRFSEGDDVGVNYPEAARWYRKAVDAGHADAMNDLAYLYVKGLGVDEDPEAAAALFQQGAEAGSGMAMFNYAICLGQGVGVEQSEFASRLWVQRSAEAGYKPAQEYVAEVQAQMRAELFGAIVEGLFSGGGESSDNSDDRDYFTEQRRNREYWDDRARRADAAGNDMEADYARRQAP